MSLAQRAWRRFNALDPRLADGLLALVLAAASAVEFLHERPESALKLPLVVGATLPLAGRRRWPLACWLVQGSFATLTMQPPTIVGFFGFLIGMYSIGVYSRWRLPSFAVLIGGIAILEIAIPEAAPPVPRQLLNPMIAAGMWLAGNAMRARQARTEALEERARRLEREQELAMRVVVADERSRIARELHDVVAHSVSVMVVQAGAARRMLDRKPERAAGALRSVESSGHEALTELRRLLGVLTDEAGEAGEAALAPQPGLGHLDALAGRVTSAGVPLDVRIEGSPRPLPPGLDLTAYRILQEALTNVLKHARGAHTEVVVTFGERELGLEVVNAGGTQDPAPAVDGRGLLGMKERVAVFGGSLEAGRRPEGGFAMRARLPLEAA